MEFISHRHEHFCASIPDGASQSRRSPTRTGWLARRFSARVRAATKVVIRPKGLSIYSDEFRHRVLAAHSDALIIVDQGSFDGAVTPGVPTLTIDHHQPNGVPLGVFLLSADRYPSDSMADLCYRLVGEPDVLLPGLPPSVSPAITACKRHLRKFAVPSLAIRAPPCRKLLHWSTPRDAVADMTG